MDDPIGKLVTELSGAFANPTFTDDSVEEVWMRQWVQHLHEFSPNVLAAATDVLILTRRTSQLPTVGEVRCLCDALKKWVR